MSGVVIEFSDFLSRRRGGTGSSAEAQSATPQFAAVLPPPVTGLLDFRFWEGASGARYVHHVYSLVGCPQLPPAVCLLVAVETGACRLLDVMQLDNEAPSLNLAHIRHRGAMLGATEVHVHLLAATADRSRVAADLAAALLPPGQTTATA